MKTSTMSGVTIRNLTKRFGDSVVAVDDFSLEVEPGEFVTLLGPSGCGKTTTLRCIAGLETADEGEILVGDTVVFSAARKVEVPPERRGAGMVFQSYAIWPHLTVYANVAYPLKMRRMDKGEIRRRVAVILEAVDLLGYEDRVPSALSGGQQQRVALARAMIGDNRLLLFDEPLSNLDAKLRASMRNELRSLHASMRRTSIYVTHDQLEAMVLSDRIVVMRHGKSQQIGTPEEVFTRPVNRFVADFVGFNNFIPAEVQEVTSGDVVARLAPNGAVMRCAHRDGLAEGDAIVLAIRGRHCELSPVGFDDKTNVTKTRVVDSIYLGDTYEYTLETEGLRLKVEVAYEPGGQLVDGDGDVYVRFPGQHLIPLAD